MIAIKQSLKQTKYGQVIERLPSWDLCFPFYIVALFLGFNLATENATLFSMFHRVVNQIADCWIFLSVLQMLVTTNLKEWGVRNEAIRFHINFAWAPKYTLSQSLYFGVSVVLSAVVLHVIFRMLHLT